MKLDFQHGSNVAATFIRNAKAREQAHFLKLTVAGRATNFSFGDIRDGACRYNAHFRASGLGQGSVVAIILRHSVELYTAFLGAIMAGLVPTIMPFPTPKQDPEKHWKSHRDLFELTEIKAVFTYPENLEGIRSYLSEQLDYLSTPEDVHPNGWADDINHGDLAVLQHSSGTTALKKGVMLTHDAIFNQVRSYAAELSITSDARIVTWLPLYHDMGFVACFLMPMIVGCSISHLDAFAWSARPTLLLDEIDEFAGEYVWLPNFAYNHIVNSLRPGREWDLGSLKALINCSEPCKPDTFDAFRRVTQFRRLPRKALQVCYAMAENVFAVTQTDISMEPTTLMVSEGSLREGLRVELAREGDPRAVGILSCGKVLEGTSVRILGSSGRFAEEDGYIGEIAITGESLYSGYYKRPSITAKRLVDGWHRTGDIGFVYDDQLFVIGRVDDLLIIRGKNIYAHEVEEAINSLGLVLPGRAVAFTDYSDSKGEAALVVLAEAEDLSKETEIRREARRTIETNFGVPLADFRLFPPRSLRKTTSGKLSRADNIELYRES